MWREEVELFFFLSMESVHPFYQVQSCQFFLISTYLFSSLQSLSIHLTSTKGPIEVLLCPDEENDPRSPVKNGNMDINGNSPFLKVLQGLFQIDLQSCRDFRDFHFLTRGACSMFILRSFEACSASTLVVGILTLSLKYS